MDEIIELTDRQKEKFWNSVETKGLFDCWEWKAGLTGNGSGYGQFNCKSGRKWRPYVASRVSFFLAYGPIPRGMCVLHKCDNPKCVNPAHLWLGTRQQNNDDKIKKERQARGERSGVAKLTTNQVIEIRKLVSGGMTMKIASSMFGVGPDQVSRICSRKRWAHI